MDDQRTDRSSGEDTIAPRFSIRDVLISTTLIALGIVSVVYVLRIDRLNSAPPAGTATMFALWLGGGALIGTGVFHLIPRWWVGAVLGVFVQWMITVFVIASI